MKNLTILAAALGLAVSAAPALAEDGPPKLDIEKTCRSPGRAQVQVQGSQQDSEDGCLRSERAAHDELKKRWGEFSPDAKSQCTRQSQAGGFPSYVETVTCLELATGVVPTQTNNGNAGATGGPGSPKGGGKGGEKSDVTSVPSPNQRTNPLEVLEKKP